MKRTHLAIGNCTKGLVSYYS